MPSTVPTDASTSQPLHRPRLRGYSVLVCPAQSWLIHLYHNPCIQDLGVILEEDRNIVRVRGVEVCCEIVSPRTVSEAPPLKPHQHGCLNVTRTFLTWVISHQGTAVRYVRSDTISLCGTEEAGLVLTVKPWLPNAHCSVVWASARRSVCLGLSTPPLTVRDGRH